MSTIVPIKLTRAGFESLAEIIRPIEPHASRVAFVQRLLPALYAGNPRFAAIRFVKACNVPSLIDGPGIL